MSVAAGLSVPPDGGGRPGGYTARMSVRKMTWLRVGAAIALAVMGWQVWQLFFSDREAGVRHLVNRVWLERMPRDQKDMVHVAALIEREGRRVGAVGQGSRWRLHQDFFLWRLDKDLLRTRFPQDGQRFGLRVRTWECAGQVPAPFELCLEARRGDEVLRFYSRRDWVIRPRSDGPPAAEIAWLAPAWDSVMAVEPDEELGEGAEATGASPFNR
jgi:hypothetical protein